MKLKKEINVVGAIIYSDNKILCAQRSENMSLPLKWEFPGGKIENGETEKDALIREIKSGLSRSLASLNTISFWLKRCSK